MSLSDAHHTRKMVAGACMIVAPILFLAAMVVSPGFDSSAAGYLANAADDRDAWYAMTALSLASLVFVVPAILGLMHMLREREVAAGHVGGALALIGTLAFAAQQGFNLTVWQMTNGGDPAQMTALVDRFNESAGVAVPLLGGGLAFCLGFIVLAWGLVRAHAVHPAVAGAVALGAVALAIGFTAYEQSVLIAAGVLFTLGTGAIGRMVWRETDADWEHTPEFHGIAAGTP
jgi:hypothetical protein